VALGLSAATVGTKMADLFRFVVVAGVHASSVPPASPDGSMMSGQNEGAGWGRFAAGGGNGLSLGRSGELFDRMQGDSETGERRYFENFWPAFIR